jgi:hypothetical protein
MKYYQSPLIIAAIFLVLYAIYLIADFGNATMGWGYLAGVVILIAGFVFGFIHLLLKLFLKSKRTHLITEIILISLFLVWQFLNS